MIVVDDPKLSAAGEHARRRVWRNVLIAILGGAAILGLAAGGVPQDLASRLGLIWDDGRQAQVQLVLFALGGAIALVGVGYTAQRHIIEREQGEREAESIELERQRRQDDRDNEEARRGEVDRQHDAEQERTLRERFVTVAGLLDSTAPMTRLAGITQLAALADDWRKFKPDEVQVCIDMLCGYLRSPWPEEDAREASIRRAGFKQLEERTKLHAGDKSWSHCSFNLEGAAPDVVVHFESLGPGSALVLAAHQASIFRVDRAEDSTIRVIGTTGDDVMPFDLQFGEVVGGSIDIRHAEHVSLTADVFSSRLTASWATDLSVHVVRWEGTFEANRADDVTVVVELLVSGNVKARKSKGFSITVERLQRGQLLFERLEGSVAVHQLVGAGLTAHVTKRPNADHLSGLPEPSLVIAGSPDLLCLLEHVDQKTQWSRDGATERRLSEGPFDDSLLG